MQKLILTSLLILICVSLTYFGRDYWGKHSSVEEVKITSAVLNTPPVEIPAPDDAPVLGDAKSKVTVVSFLDYEFQPSIEASKTLQTVMERYQNRVKFVFIQYLREPQKCRDINHSSEACSFARLAICENKQGKFSEIYSAFISKKSLINFSTFKSCMDSSSTFEKIKRDQAFAKQLGIQTPPSFFVAGRRVEGGMPIAVWEQSLDAILKEVK